MTDDLELLLASYPALSHAGQAWDRLVALDHDGTLHLVDGAVVSKNMEGQVLVDERLHHSVKKGAVIGAVAAVVLPVGVLAGALAGAVGGKLYKHFKGNLDKSDARSLGEFIEASNALVMVIVPAGELEPATAALEGATDTYHRGISKADADLEALWQQDGS